MLVSSSIYKYRLRTTITPRKVSYFNGYASLHTSGCLQSHVYCFLHVSLQISCHRSYDEAGKQYERGENEDTFVYGSLHISFHRFTHHRNPWLRCGSYTTPLPKPRWEVLLSDPATGLWSEDLICRASNAKHGIRKSLRTDHRYSNSGAFWSPQHMGAALLGRFRWQHSPSLMCDKWEILRFLLLTISST